LLFRERKKKKVTLYSDCCGCKGCVSINTAGTWSEEALTILYMGRRLDCRDSDTLTLKFHIVSDKIFSQNASKDEELENQSPGTAGGYHTQIIG